MEGVRNLKGIDNYSSTIKQFSLIYISKKDICVFGVINKTDGCNIPPIRFNLYRPHHENGLSHFLFWLQNF